MPYLTQNEIEVIARRVVTAYQKLSVHQGYACSCIDPELLATELLGLKVEYHALSPTGNVHGLTVFCEAEVPIYDDPEKPVKFLLDGKTILVEKRLIESYARYGRWHFILTTVEKRYKGRHQRKEQRGGFFSKSVSARPRTFQWD